MAKHARHQNELKSSDWIGLHRLETRALMSGGPIINEILAVNQSVLVDEDGAYSDVIELHNPTATAIDLDGWFLSDDSQLLTKWQFPEITLSPDEYLLVFASDKNRAESGMQLHSNFKLDGDGESIFLVEQDGATIASSFAPFPSQRADVSYGPSASAIAKELVVEKGSEWSFLDDGSDQGTAWSDPGFDDSTWDSGEAQLGYGDGDETTLISFGSNSNDKHITTYFRRTFNISDLDSAVGLSLRIQRDDGAVVFINGNEVERPNMPSGAITFETRAQSVTGSGAESTFFEFVLDPADLVEGENSIAVEIHQSSPTSSDISFDLELEIQRASIQANVFMLTPTLGSANQPGVEGFVGDTSFSVDRGFYDLPVDVEMTTSTEGATIYYTLDGSNPSEPNGIVYTGLINIATTTTLRAVATKAGFVSSNVDTHTYVFIDDVLTQGNNPAGYPATWSGLPADYELDPEIVENPAYVSEFQDAFTSIPSLSLVTDIDNLFDPSNGIYQNTQSSGINWERPTSVEWIDPSSTNGFQIDAGVRIQGGSSRTPANSPKHSFRLLFKDDYGPSKLKFPLYGEDAAQEFDTIVLRAGYNLTWHHANHTGGDQRSMAQFVRDQLIRDLQLQISGVASHGTYVHLYLNGLYWGLYNVAERPSAPFAASYYGGEKEEYDAINSGEAVDGDLVAWNAMMNLANAGLASGSAYQQIQEYLDVEQFAEYMMVSFYGGNTDWPHHNWYAARKREPGGQFRFYSWDAEHTLKDVNTKRIDDNDANSPGRLFQQLRANAEFRVLVGDLVQEHFFNGGALSSSAVTAQYSQLIETVRDPVIAESARWGDYRRDVHRRNGPYELYERDVQWAAENQRLLNDYLPQRSDIVVQQFRDELLFSVIDAPSFSQHGGRVSTGYQLVITNEHTSGDVYYTLDGSDPRLAGGTISSSSLLWDGTPITITENVTVSARVLDGSVWSAKTVASFRVNTPADATSLAITELNYNPFTPTLPEIGAGYTIEDSFEFVEFLNIGDERIDLAGVHFDDGIVFDFSLGDVFALDPGELVLIVKDRDAFEMRYGTTDANGQAWNIAGVYAGTLRDSGEDIVLMNSDNLDIHRFEYKDGGSFPGRADGKGSSLEMITPGSGIDYADGSNWRSSSEFGGSPGFAGVGPDNRVVVNEVLSHTDLPLKDSIEIYNTTGASIDISGWYLSDDDDDYLKFRIPDGTVIASGGYFVFDEDDFNDSGNPLKDFALDSAHGDEIYLIEADLNATNNNGLRGFVDKVSFGATANGESLGRVPNGSGKLAPLIDRSLGNPNGDPRVGPVIISEVMYNPPDPGTLPLGVDANDLEFVELYNPTDSTVDLTNWSLGNAVEFAFPDGQMLGSEQTFLILAFDPTDVTDPDRLNKIAAFESVYGVSLSSLNVLGGFSNQLNNGGDDLRLYRPDEPPAEELTFFPLLLEDVVEYDDVNPWPVSPDGLGDSLQRLTVDSFGSFSTSWQGVAPTPGTVDFSGDTTPPTVTNIVYNGGDDQRSTLMSIALAFSESVGASLAADDLELTNVTAGAVISAADLQMSWNEEQFIATWLFPNHTGGSLADGNYTLILRSQDVIDDAGNHLDGNLDGSSIGSSDDDWAGSVWRFFGDSNADRTVSIVELFAFRAAFGTTDSDPTYNASLDINADTQIGIAELFPFRANYLNTLEPPGEFPQSTQFSQSTQGDSLAQPFMEALVETPSPMIDFGVPAQLAGATAEPSETEFVASSVTDQKLEPIVAANVVDQSDIIDTAVSNVNSILANAMQSRSIQTHKPPRHVNGDWQRLVPRSSFLEEFFDRGDGIF